MDDITKSNKTSETILIFGCSMSHSIRRSFLKFFFERVIYSVNSDIATSKEILFRFDTFYLSFVLFESKHRSRPIG